MGTKIEKIYERAKDNHVRKIALYSVNNAICYDSSGTLVLTKDQIVDILKESEKRT